MPQSADWARGVSVAAFVAQLAVLWFLIAGERDIGAFAFVGCLCSGLLLPVLLARKSKPRLNIALLVGLVSALLLAKWIVSGVLSATNSTAVLGLILLPVFQWASFLLVTAIGYAAEADRENT